MEFALGAVGLGVVASAVVWAITLTRKVRKAGANYAPVRQETPGQRIVSAAIAAHKDGPKSSEAQAE